MKLKRIETELTSRILSFGRRLCRITILAGYFMLVASCTPTFPSSGIDPVPLVKACNGQSPCWLTRKGVQLVGFDAQTDVETDRYYTVIGAIQGITRETFVDFKIRNGFGLGSDLHARYFNGGDLNLGRDMHCRQNGDNIACYVSNHGPEPFKAGKRNPAWPDVAEALDQTLLSTPPFATVAMEFIPHESQVDVTVHERDGVSGGNTPPQCLFTSNDGAPTQVDVDSGIWIQPGDEVMITASGQMWAGVCATFNHGPEGWAGVSPDPKFPLASSDPANNFPYGLIGRLDTEYFYIGAGKQFTHMGAPAKLWLRSNDDQPGNGTGEFQVHIQVTRTFNNVKFYVYDKNGDLANLAALDGEGEKAVPQICLACHGGSYDRSAHSVFAASFLPFDMSQFKFGIDQSATLQAQQETFRRLNLLVKHTAPNFTNPNDPVRSLIDGLYRDSGGVETVNATPSLTYTPSGWAGHESLYLEVMAPYCRGCHIAQRQGLDFLDYNQILAAKASLAADLCTSHNMPHAQVPFEKIQDTILASGFSASTRAEVQALGINCLQ